MSQNEYVQVLYLMTQLLFDRGRIKAMTEQAVDNYPDIGC